MTSVRGDDDGCARVPYVALSSFYEGGGLGFHSHNSSAKAKV